MCQEKKKRKKRGIDYWDRKYIKIIKRLSIENINLIEERYRPAIQRGIALSTTESKFQKIDDLESKKNCLEMEELIYYIPKILSANPPSPNYVTTGVKRFTDRRKYSWFDDVFHKSEFEKILFQDMILQIVGNDLDSRFADAALKAEDWSYRLNGINIYTANPLDYITLSENQLLVLRAVRLVCSSGKHAECYRRIFEYMMNNVDIGKEHADQIGVPKDKVASVKAQFLAKLSRQIVALTDDPEWLDRMSRVKTRAKDKGNEITSTKDRKAQYKKNLEEPPPIYTKIWEMINGVLTLTYDDSRNVLDDKHD